MTDLQLRIIALETKLDQFINCDLQMRLNELVVNLGNKLERERDRFLAGADFAFKELSERVEELEAKIPNIIQEKRVILIEGKKYIVKKYPSWNPYMYLADKHILGINYNQGRFIFVSTQNGSTASFSLKELEGIEQYKEEI